MDPVLTIPLLALGIPILIVPTVTVLRYKARRREWEHLERMRAMELGLPVPRSDAWPALTAIALGLGVPVGSLAIAWLADVSTHAGEDAYIPATIVGLAGVFSGGKLARQLAAARTPAAPPMSHHLANGKAPVDPDAFDVAGRRG